MMVNLLQCASFFDKAKRNIFAKLIFLCLAASAIVLLHFYCHKSVYLQCFYQQNLVEINSKINIISSGHTRNHSRSDNKNKNKNDNACNEASQAVEKPKCKNETRSSNHIIKNQKKVQLRDKQNQANSTLTQKPDHLLNQTNSNLTQKNKELQQARLPNQTKENTTDIGINTTHINGILMEPLNVNYTRNIYFTVKTTHKYYTDRLLLLMLTWLQAIDKNKVRYQTRIFVNTE